MKIAGRSLRAVPDVDKPFRIDDMNASDIADKFG